MFIVENPIKFHDLRVPPPHFGKPLIHKSFSARTNWDARRRTVVVWAVAIWADVFWVVTCHGDERNWDFHGFPLNDDPFHSKWV